MVKKKKVLLLKLGFMLVLGHSPRKKSRKPNEEKNKRKEMRKNHNSGCFNSHGRCLQERLLHDGKNNMMLCEWCHKHSVGADHKSAFVIGYRNLKYDSVVAYVRAVYCVTVCVPLSLCVLSFNL